MKLIFLLGFINLAYSDAYVASNVQNAFYGPNPPYSNVNSPPGQYGPPKYQNSPPKNQYGPPISNYGQRNNLYGTKKYGEHCASPEECESGLICSKKMHKTVYLCDCPSAFQWSYILNKCFKCPDGWFASGSKCYQENKNEKNWNDARIDCAKKNSILVEFNKGIFVDTLQTFFKANSFLKGNYLIGLQTINIPGNWTWSNGCSLPACGPWWVGCEANNEGQNKEIIFGCAQTDGKLISTVDCYNYCQNYICELIDSNEPTAYKSALKPINQPYEKCKDYNQCPYNLICKEGTCQCPDNYQWSSESAKCKFCKKDWKMYNDECYLISNEKLSFFEAKNYCSSRYAKLLVADTEYIVDFLSAFFIDNQLNRDYWIGASSNGNSWNWLNDAKINDGFWWGGCGSPGPTPTIDNCVSTFGIAIQSTPCSKLLNFICQQNYI